MVWDLDTRTTLSCGTRKLDLAYPHVMGILNLTPDSFSDGGTYSDLDAALRQAERMCEEGAAIIDVGGESTRPGALPVSAEEEIDRVVPVIDAIHARFDTIISIDTSKVDVMRAAVHAGAGFINDVHALRGPGTLEFVADSGLPVCLMHMLGEPREMQENPEYEDVVEEVKSFLALRVANGELAGIAKSQMVIDPGFGFGKTVAHNMRLTKQLEAFQSVGVPLLFGASRKSTVGAVLGKPTSERLYGSVALAALAVERGAKIIRTHDVGPTVDAVKMTVAMMNEGENHG